MERNRSKETKITRLRFGKSQLNEYMHYLKIHPNGLCESCQVMESTEHYLMNCEESMLHKHIKEKCMLLNIKFELPIVLNNKDILNLIFEKDKRKI